MSHTVAATEEMNDILNYSKGTVDLEISKSKIKRSYNPETLTQIRDHPKTVNSFECLGVHLAENNGEL